MKLTLKQLKNIVDNYRKAKEIHWDMAPNKFVTLFSVYVENIISTMFALYFGENNTDLIYNFITNSDDNKFETVEQLYEYLSDKYSELVRKDSALTVDQLRVLFPKEEIFKFFEKVIKEYEGSNTK